MNTFRNFSTLKKLMIAFSFVCLTGAAAGYLGIRNMGVIAGLLDDVYADNLMPILHLARGNTQALYHNRALYQYVLETDKATMDETSRKMEGFEAAMKEKLDLYRKTNPSEEEGALLKKFDASWVAYREAADRTMRLAYSGRHDEARSLMKGDALTTFRVARDLYTEIINLNEKRAEKANSDAASTYAQARAVLATIVCISTALGLLIGLVIARMVSKPLGQAVSVLQSVAAGDLTRSLDVKSRDEVGQMAEALNRAVESMRTTLQEVSSASDSVASSAQQLAAASEELSSGAQQQASNLEETTASMEEITSSVRQNADNAKQANQLASASRDAAENGGQVVSSAVAAMSEINSSSKRIADIITTIDEIAFQTNLLALNAAVEAARAGEQGRGFAVVAAEVRSLAQRSATAAKEIKSLIQDSVRKVDAGSEMVNRSGQVLLEIVGSVKRVTDIVGEIAAASQEQATGVEQVGKAMTQMDQVTQANAAQTEELSSTAQGLTASSEELQAMVAKFKLGEHAVRRAASRPSAPAPQNAPRAAASLTKLSKAVARPSHSAERAEAGKPVAHDAISSQDGFVEF